jgi:hypothetical protein
VLSALDIRFGLGRLPVQSDLRVWILFIKRVAVMQVLGFKNHDDQRSEFLAHGRIEESWGASENGRTSALADK